MIVGVLILSGAVNTSLIGVNGVLNRVAEDGVLIDWFRKPHRKYGTTYRILNTMALLQIATILASRGNVLLLGEAYAFGVVWSFALKSLGVLVLRYQRHDQEYKFPLNVRIGHTEIPIGLGITTSALFLIGVANLFSKRIATIYGVSFTIVLYTLFMISERINARKQNTQRSDLEKFNLDHQSQVNARDPPRAARVRSGGGPRLSTHAASGASSRKDQFAASGYRRHDRAAPLSGRWGVRTPR